MIARFKKVTPALYRGGAPSVKDVQVLKKMGITKIVSLDFEAGNRIQRPSKLLGIQQIMLPISAKNFAVLDKFPTMDWLEILGGGPTYVHCLHGKDRTGLVVALFRVQSGWPVDKAIKEADKSDFCVGLPKRVREFYTKLIRQADKNSDTNNAMELPLNDGITSDSLLNPDYDIYNQDPANSFAVPFYDSTYPPKDESYLSDDNKGYASGLVPQVSGEDDDFISGLEPGGAGSAGYGFSGNGV